VSGGSGSSRLVSVGLVAPLLPPEPGPGPVSASRKPASGRSSESRWTYVASVKAGEWCPSHTCTCFCVQPRPEEHRRAGVAERVEPHPRHARPSAGLLQHAAHQVRRVEHGALLGRDDELVRLRAALRFPRLSERPSSALREWHVTAPVPRLRWREAATVVAATHADAAAAEVDVLPAERDRLADSQTAVGEELEEQSPTGPAQEIRVSGN
jgi:hypothetical protein